LRAEKPEMKGKAIRKKVCAAWSKHCFALPLSACSLSGATNDVYRAEEIRRCCRERMSDLRRRTSSLTFKLSPFLSAFFHFSLWSIPPVAFTPTVL